MCAALLGLAYVLVFTPLGFPELEGGKHWWLFAGDSDTARDLVSTILSGTITMTSLVVSITMVVLSLASGQLGPRLIDNFLRDREIQAVLGLFTGTVFYCLFVLRSSNAERGANSVPHVAITTATVLAMLCLLALLFYVHKIARSIVADTVVAEVADSLETAILRESRHTPSSQPDPARARYVHAVPLSLGASGYVQVIEYDQLVELAHRENILIDVKVRPGNFVLRGSLAAVVQCNSRVSDKAEEKIQGAFTIECLYSWLKFAFNLLPYCPMPTLVRLCRGTCKKFRERVDAILKTLQIGQTLARPLSALNGYSVRENPAMVKRPPGLANQHPGVSSVA